MCAVASSETLRSVIEAGRAGKRLDELSTARVIAKVAHQVHSAQQKAGAGKAVGPLSPAHVSIASSGEVSLALGDGPALGYSAPEQASGGAGDRKSDVFCVGVLLWESLTHQRLFEAMNDTAVRLAVQERAITAPSEINANIPAELSAICMRALSRNPTDRYQSLKAMAVEIEEFLGEAGYEDNDTRIAQHLAQLAGSRTTSGTQPPRNAPLPPASKAKETLLGTAPLSVATKTDAPRPKSPSSMGEALAAALSNAGGGQAKPASSNGAAASTPAASGGLPVAAGAAAAVGVAAAPPGEAPAPLTVLPPVLPSGSDAALKPPAKVETRPVVDDIKATIVESTPVALINAAEDAKKLAVKPEAKPEAKPETKPEAKPSDAVPTKQVKRETGPHPASVVSLPGRESKADVLAGWGWGTDKHDALPPGAYEDDDDLDQPRSSRKTLVYAIGGGLAVALIATVIAFAAGGSSSKPSQDRTLARQNQEAVAKQALATGDEPGSAGSGLAPTAGSDVVAGSGSDVAAAGSGSADTGSATAGSADVAAMTGSSGSDAGSAVGSAAAISAEGQAAADKAAADKAAADKLAAEQAAADKAAAEDAKKQAALDEAARKKAEADAKKQAAAEAAAKKAEERRLAREEAARRKAEAAKTTKKRTDKATTTSKTVATADTKKTDSNGKPIVAETAYRQGLQAFARGDNQGAISSLRSAQSANPSYAPTYRGLGLVYEKMGQKDAARVAYKRYLQLSPNAGDAEIIRGRLERLGS
jgi:hypothetical protein